MPELDTIRQWVETYDKLTAGHYTADGRWSPNHFLREWLTDFPDVRPGDMQMTAKECFTNAGIITVARGYDFVDGYVTVLGLPIRHAWNVDIDGRVLDFTLDDPANHVYAGVRFPAKVAREVVLSRAWPYTEGVVGALQRMPEKRRNRLLKRAGFINREEQAHES